MKTNIKLNKKSEELRLETYEAQISFSANDADAIKNNLTAFMTQLLEDQGEKVRDVIFSPKFWKLAQNAAMKGEVQSIRIAHIVYPPQEQSLWIQY